MIDKEIEMTKKEETFFGSKTAEESAPVKEASVKESPEVAEEKSVPVTEVPKTPDEVANQATEVSADGSDLYGGNGTVGDPPKTETRKFSMDAPYTDIARNGGHEYSYHRPDYVGE